MVSEHSLCSSSCLSTLSLGQDHASTPPSVPSLLEAAALVTAQRDFHVPSEPPAAEDPLDLILQLSWRHMPDEDLQALGEILPPSGSLSPSLPSVEDLCDPLYEI